VNAPADAGGTAGDDESWLENWQRNEIRWLAERTVRLERQLWRRTMMLGCVLAGLLGLATGVGVFSAMGKRERAETMVLPLPPAPVARPAPEPAPAIVPAMTLGIAPAEAASEPEPALAVVPEALLAPEPEIAAAPMTVAEPPRAPALRAALGAIKERLDRPEHTATASR
jgi:hypothetical protein